MREETKMREAMSELVVRLDSSQCAMSHSAPTLHPCSKCASI